MRTSFASSLDQQHKDEFEDLFESLDDMGSEKKAAAMMDAQGTQAKSESPASSRGDATNITERLEQLQRVALANKGRIWIGEADYKFTRDYQVAHAQGLPGHLRKSLSYKMKLDGGVPYWNLI